MGETVIVYLDDLSGREGEVWLSAGDDLGPGPGGVRQVQGGGAETLGHHVGVGETAVSIND